MRGKDAQWSIYSDTNPDLLLNFPANVQQRRQIRAMPAAGGYDNDRRGRYSDFGAAAIDAVVARMMEPLPGPARRLTAAATPP